MIIVQLDQMVALEEEVQEMWMVLEVVDIQVVQHTIIHGGHMKQLVAAVLIMLERIRTMKLVLILAMELLLLHSIVLPYRGFQHQKIPVQFRLESSI